MKRANVNGYAKTLMATLGAGALVWLALDYLGHKANAATVRHEQDLALAGVRWEVSQVRKAQGQHCRLLAKIAERLKIDTAAVDCGKE